MIDVAVILAGGKSTRFGTPKGLVKINGVPLVEYLAQEAMKAGIREIYISTDDFKIYGGIKYTLIPDEYKECGPLAGIHSVLNKVDSYAICCLSCDLPNLTSKEIQRLIEEAMSNPADFVYATTPSGEQPLCSIISKSIFPELTTALKNRHLSVFDFMLSVNYRPVLFNDETPFLNLNTPDDLNPRDEIMLDPEHTIETAVVRYRKSDGLIEMDDPIIRESLIKVWLNENEVAVIQALRKDVEDLAVGFLYSECLISDISAIESIEFNNKLDVVTVLTMEQSPLTHAAIVRTVAPGCGQVLFSIRPAFAEKFDPIETDYIVMAENIVSLMSCLLKESKLFQLTGGVHIAALSDCEKMINACDDIGRHNCIDKIIGRELQNPVVLPEKRMILTSGRVSTDIITKAIRFNSPFVVSHSAVSEGAVQLAKKYRITLIGFARGARFNIYTHPERIEVYNGD